MARPSTDSRGDDRDDTVALVGAVRPGSPLDRLFSHGECLDPDCAARAVAPHVLCAAHLAEAATDR